MDSLKGYITAQEIGEKQFLTNSEGDENPKTHEHKVSQLKKPFGTMSSLMTTKRYKNPTSNCFYCQLRDIKTRHQIASTPNNRIGGMSATTFQHCQDEKKKPKDDTKYVFIQDMQWRNVNLKNHVIIVRRRTVTTGACAPDYSKRKGLHPTAFLQLTQLHLW